MKRLRDIGVMTRFDLLFMIRSRETLLWMFVMPVLFMFLIGTVTKRTFSGPGQKTKMAVHDEDGGVIARAFLRNLAAMDYELVMENEAPEANATSGTGADSETGVTPGAGIDAETGVTPGAGMDAETGVTPGAGVDAETEATLEASAVLPDSVSPPAEQVSNPVDNEIVKTTPAAGVTYRRNLYIPAGFTDGALRGEKQTATFEIRGEPDRSDDLDRVKINRALFLTLGDVAVVTSEGAAIDDSSLAQVSRREKAMILEVRAAGKRQEIPGGFDQAVPGILVMFVLLVLLTTGGVLLVTEREEGLLRRLASAPIDRGDIITAKICSRILLGGVQTLFAMLVGWLLFQIDWAGALGGVLLLLAFYSIALAALSVLYGNLARSRGQAVGLGVLTANLMAALGGCWWPVEITPVFMQKIAWAFPTGWAMYGLHRLLAFGEPLAAIVPSLILLTGATVVFFLLARRTFRFE